MKKVSLLIFLVFVLLAVQLVSLFAQTRSVKIERINPPTLYETSAYSHVTTVSGTMKLVIVAGQLGRAAEDSGPCQHVDMREQYIVTMENVGKALAAGGATWDDVVRIRRFTTDMDAYFAVARDLPLYWDPEKPPSSTLVEVSRLANPCYLVEVDVTAVVEPD